MDSVKRVLNERGMCVKQGMIIVCDGGEWNAVMNA